MIGRPGDRTIGMNGGSTASYLARTLLHPCLFCFCFLGLEAKGLLDFQGRRGITSVVRWNLRAVVFGVDKGLFDDDLLTPILFGRGVGPRLLAHGLRIRPPCAVVKNPKISTVNLWGR